MCVCVHVLVLLVAQPLMQQFAARVEKVCLLSCVVGREEGGQSDRRVSWRCLKVRCRVLQLKTDPAFSTLKGGRYLRAA